MHRITLEIADDPAVQVDLVQVPATWLTQAYGFDRPALLSTDLLHQNRGQRLAFPCTVNC